MKTKNKSLAVAKLNFRTIKPAYIITGIIMGAMLVNEIVFIILNSHGLDLGGSDGIFGNFLYLLIILSAILIPARNFTKIMNLGGKRASFFNGSIITYAIMSAAVSLAVIILYYTYERLIMNFYGSEFTLNVIYWFGWIARGPVAAFLQQFAFLFLLAAFIHTLTAAQDKWYGWVADIAIIAIISVFTPIAPLRGALVSFFNLIIFHEHAPVQIIACLVLGCAIYALNKLILARKAI